MKDIMSLFKKTTDNTTGSLRNLDTTFSKFPPYRKGSEVGGSLSKFIDNLVDKVLK
tara:strand:+ start:354 stop:521 length:168 start_codon:yes stop_codon:yes gene_type:complete